MTDDRSTGREGKIEQDNTVEAPAPMKPSADSHGEALLADIERQIQEIFPQARKVKALPLSPDRKEALAVIHHEPVPPKDVADKRIEMIKHFAGGGISCLPLFYNKAEWDELNARWGEQEWLTTFDPLHGPIRLAELYKGRKDFPASWRKLLLRTIETYIGIIDSMMTRTHFPVNFILSFTLAMVRNVFGLLYATKGLVCTSDSKVISLFEAHFAKNPNFKTDDPLLTIELSAMTRKFDHFILLTGKTPNMQDEGYLLGQVLDFLKRSQQYIREEWTSQEERRRQKTIFVSVAASILFVTIVALLWIFKPGIPIWPIRDTSVIRKPGGIVGVYYSGTEFDRKVLQRVDRQIIFRTYESVAQNVPDNKFSARWTGYIRFPESRAYYLCTQSDDGVRVYLNERKIIDDWKEKPMTETCKKVRVRKGWFRLKVEYFDAVGEAVINLLWGKEKGKVVSVPAENLCCGK